MPVRDSIQPTVTINGTESTNARILSISRRLYNTPASATFELLGEEILSASRIQNTEVRDLHSNDLVVIQIPGLTGALTTSHIGRITGASVAFSETESVVFKSEFSDHMFGLPQNGRLEVSYPKPGPDHFINKPTVFNPQFEDRAFPNMWTGKEVARQYNVLVDPESLPRDSLFNQTFSNRFWTVADAVMYLCWTLNPEELYLKNPIAREDLTNVFGEDSEILRNHVVREGDFLPSVLDDLLTPFGFLWYIDFPDSNKASLRFDRRGGSRSIPVGLQVYGQELDTNQTNLAAMDASYRISSGTYNHVTIQGDAEEVEFTAELVPGWPASLDDTSVTQLHPSSPEIAADPRLRRVWRDWVLNEGGDYASDAVFDPTDYFDLGNVFGYPILPKRRVFKPTLTLGQDNRPIGNTDGIHIEIWNGRSWVEPSDVPGLGSPKILKAECGVRLFEGRPPASLMRIGISNIKVRVTATVMSDQRVQGEAVSPNSHLEDNRQRLIDMSSAYKKRTILRDGDNKSIFATKVDGNDLLSAEVDHSNDLNGIAARLLDSWNQAQMSGKLVVEGLDLIDAATALGATITKIDGRNTGFETNAPGNRSTHPIITGVTYDVQSQRTILTLDTFRRSV